MKMQFGDPYWARVCCNFCWIESAVLAEALYVKGYILKLSHTSRYSFPWCMQKTVVRSCHGPSRM